MPQRKSNNITYYVIANLTIILVSIITYQWINSAFLEKAKEQHTKDIHFLATQIRKDYFYNEGKTVSSLLTKLEMDFTKDVSNKLNIIKDVTNADIVYLLDRSGTVTHMVRNPREPDITGKNYGFRPYFKNAIMGDNFVYTAIGVTTKKRGIYFSSPIYKNDRITSVLVLKRNFEEIDQYLASHDDSILLINPDGIIFSSNKPEWRLMKIENTNNVYDKFRYAELTNFKILKLQQLRSRTSRSDAKIYNDYSMNILGEPWRIISIRHLVNFKPKSMYSLAIVLTLMFLATVNIFLYFVLQINFQKEQE